MRRISPVICKELIEIAQKEIIEEDEMGKFKPDEKDNEARSLALEEFFGDSEIAKKKRNRDNFILEEDRDHFIYSSGFLAGCRWMLKRFSNKYLIDLDKIKLPLDKSNQPNIVDLPELPETKVIDDKEKLGEK